MDTTATANDTATATCACCGAEFTDAELVALMCHNDIRLCGNCIGWLASKRGQMIRAVPMLATDDVAASAAFWATAGFEVETYDEGFAAAYRDGVELHLATPDPDGRDRGEAYVHAADVDGLHSAWKEAGLDVTDVADQPWGMREFSVVDPGNNRVRVGRSI